MQAFDYVPITIGASGAVFGLLLAFGLLYPNSNIYLYFLFPIKAKYFVVAYGVLEFFFGIAARPGDNVAHFAHLGGMLFGLILILYWWKGNAIRHFFSPPRRKNVADYYPERKSESSSEIDRILDKVKQSGYNSLTEHEKQTLFRAKK